MITHSYYEEDPRVTREVRALVDRGRPVDVFALRRPGDRPDTDTDGVRVHRIDVRRHQGAGLGTYLAEYLAFLLRAGLAVARAHRRRRYVVVQVHTLPDFLVLAAAPVRVTGVPVVLDLHEAMPEFFRSRFPRAGLPLFHGALLLQERFAIAFAQRVITVNDALADRLRGMGIREGKIAVVPNSPLIGLFDPGAHQSRAFMADGVLRLIYAGALTPLYEIGVVIDAIAELGRRRPTLPIHFDVYGRGDSAPALATRAAAGGVSGQVTLHGRIPIEDVAAAIAAADVGIAPTRRDGYTDLSLSTKIFEYGAMRKPVVASRLPLVERTFGSDSVTAYEPGDVDSLVGAISSVIDDPAGREVRVDRTLSIVRQGSWEQVAGAYVDLIEALATDGLSSATAATGGRTLRAAAAAPRGGAAEHPREDV
jgi:glycosyltransferase involved in cell wall biosynthesis